MSLISCLSLLLSTESKDHHFQWRAEKKYQWAYLRLIKKHALKAIKKSWAKQEPFTIMSHFKIIFNSLCRTQGWKEVNATCGKLTPTGSASSLNTFCLHFVKCVLTPKVECLCFISSHLFLHHCNPTDTWPELGSFENLRYSGQSLIARFWRAILIKLSLVPWNSFFIHEISPLYHSTLDLLSVCLDFAPSITLLELDFPVLHSCLEW